MKSLHIRNLEDATLEGLKWRARRHRRSLQKEVEDLLSDAARMLPPESAEGGRHTLRLHTVSRSPPARQTTIGTANPSTTMMDDKCCFLDTNQSSGKRIHDANLVATMRAHGLVRLRTNNAGDFAPFKGIKVETLSDDQKSEVWRAI